MCCLFNEHNSCRNFQHVKVALAHTNNDVFIKNVTTLSITIQLTTKVSTKINDSATCWHYSPSIQLTSVICTVDNCSNW